MVKEEDPDEGTEQVLNLQPPAAEKETRKDFIHNFAQQSDSIPQVKEGKTG